MNTAPRHGFGWRGRRSPGASGESPDVARSFLERAAASLDLMVLRKHPWMIHFFNETIDHHDIEALVSFLAARKPLQDGEYLAQYERMFRDTIDPTGAAFSFGAGRMALYAVLEAMGIGRSDEVIVPAFTCEVVIHALLYRGCRPVYADIDPVTFNLSVPALARRITPATKAIIAQHTFGVPCDLDGIRAVVGARGIKVIEDCALAMGSCYRGTPVGGHGDAAIFSTDRTKMVSTVSGGIAYARDPDLIKHLAAVQRRAPFLSKGTLVNLAIQTLGGAVCYWPYLYPAGWAALALGHKSGLAFRHPEDRANFITPPNYPCRFSNLQACIGIRQLAKLGAVVQRRRATVQQYRDVLGARGIPAHGPDFTMRFPLLLRDRAGFIRRWRRYVEIGTWFDSPAWGWKGDLARVGYEHGMCPVAESVHRSVINLPTHQTRERLQQHLYEIVGTIRPEDVITYP